MSVAVLLDTNVIIKREDDEVIEEDIQKLINLLNASEFHILIHKNSFKDINRDKNEKRKEIIKSKMNSYNILKSEFDFTKDTVFCDLMNYKDNPNDYVDNSLLYSLLKNEVSFLITEDKGIHKKANRLNNRYPNFNERIFTVNEAISFFKEQTPIVPYFIKKTTANYLDINDPIFDKLKKDYSGFNDWFKKIHNERRECLVYYNSNESLGALLIYKDENENINIGNNNLPVKDRIKIATMVVTSNGYKIGELFLSWIIDYALKNNKEELYLTHYRDGDNDLLINLITEYGFVCVGAKNDGELVYVKNINPEIVYSKLNECGDDCNYSELSKKFYPYFYDGENVDKYIVPIKTHFHEKLFLNEAQQVSLLNYTSNKEDAIEVQRHTIKKAYISNANANLKPGDIVLFYETPKKGISEIGVVEKSDKDLNYVDLNISVGKRSVYKQDELKEYENHNNVILFIYSKKIDKVKPEILFRENILKGYPQSIQKISEENYVKLKELMK